jgi:hypothetical protein
MGDGNLRARCLRPRAPINTAGALCRSPGKALWEPRQGVLSESPRRGYVPGGAFMHPWGAKRNGLQPPRQRPAVGSERAHQRSQFTAFFAPTGQTRMHPPPPQLS